MATAIGTYVTLALLKARVGIATADTADDAVQTLICDQVNQFVESVTGRVLAPVTSTTYLYDGDGGRSLFLPMPVDKAPIGGIRAVSLLEVSPNTGGTFETVPAGDYFLRQRVGVTGPFERLIWSDVPTGTFAYFPRGLGVIRVTGTAGWAAIPDDIAEVAVVIATRAWHGSQAGQADIVGTDEMGRPLVSRFVAGRDRDTLRRYTLADALA
jgi:hypothetical protein